MARAAEIPDRILVAIGGERVIVAHSSGLLPAALRGDAATFIVADDE